MIRAVLVAETVSAAVVSKLKSTLITLEKGKEYHTEAKRRNGKQGQMVGQEQEYCHPKEENWGLCDCWGTVSLFLEGSRSAGKEVRLT